jgi:hypothetical protein
MNSLLHHPFPRVLLVLAAAALLLPSVRAQENDSAGSTARVKFSDPGKPGTLKLAFPWAETRITGTDSNEIVVTSSLDQKGKAEVDHEGFRRLDTDVTFDLVEKDNVAVISVAGDNIWATQGTEFEIKVPRNTNLIIRTEIGGDVEVNGVEGDLDINSINGEVTLRDIAGSAVVNTMNGEIRASFKRAPVKPVSISTMNGEIDVRLPADTKANLRMRTHNGSIRTNFPDKVLQTKTEKVTGRPGADLAEENRALDRATAQLDREHAQIAREAAKIASEAARAGMAIAREVTREVSRELARSGIDGMPPVPPVPPIPPLPNFGGKSIVGTLNDGGVDIKLTSMNGAITLRQGK